MAEAAGLAIGTIGLAGLFTACVECVDYISLGRNHGKDFEISMTKLILLKARLSAWGESLLVTQEGQETPALREHWLAEQDNVGRCLISIKTMFEDGSQLESRYGLERLSTDQSLSVIPQGQKSKPFQQIEDKLKLRIHSRQEHTSVSKKTRWAIRDKKKFDSLLADLAFFIDGLEDLSDRIQVLDLQRRLLETHIQAITDVNSIRMLEDASTQAQADSSSQESRDKTPSKGTHGHTYIDTIIKDRARVLNGNLGLQGQSSHSYHGTQAYDDVRVVQGDMSNEAARDFFK
ncbi:MAG: hypothetical protein LQ338_008129 [Usnochroma carphineum]|nr:MAG: hypothetical protein LQ338_008129 [Usnochroma carphineum]